jgi:thiamine-phosphate pyrophosphorylase
VTLPRLYAVLDSEVSTRRGWKLDDLARACLAGGVRFLQIRAKHLAGGPLLDLCQRVVEDAAETRALVVVNDRADVASLAGAWGVHVGQQDLPPRAIQSAMGEQLRIGLSTHTRQQVREALAEPISYLAAGPVFQTATKDTGYDPVGLDFVRLASHEAARTSATPVVAIGGIDLDCAVSVIEAGATSVAVLSDLFTGNNPEARARAFVNRLGSL